MIKCVFNFNGWHSIIKYILPKQPSFYVSKIWFAIDVKKYMTPFHAIQKNNGFNPESI